ncbi:hypothetical protein [Actinomadura madurae]|uniref:hypothetical protein n=1 Tax=Actinomadura madurae TaxID=1993 RepID=UPI0020D25026|nr:hypothetical protein [Actinomadura madurae]MCQ0014644.1 hypothetical protein [Actinomadura madurae]
MSAEPLEPPLPTPGQVHRVPRTIKGIAEWLPEEKEAQFLREVMDAKIGPELTNLLAGLARRSHVRPGPRQGGAPREDDRGDEGGEEDLPGRDQGRAPLPKRERVTAAKSGWTVFCSETAGAILHSSLPKPIEDRLVEYLCELAWQGRRRGRPGVTPARQAARRGRSRLRGLGGRHRRVHRVPGPPRHQGVSHHRHQLGRMTGRPRARASAAC